MLQPAGFWIRFLALVIDSILWFILRAGLGFLLLALGIVRDPTAAEEQMLQQMAAQGVGPDQLLGASFKIAYDSGTHITMTMFGLLSIIISILFVSLKGGTPGKLALGLRIQMANSGEKPSMWRAFLREVVGKWFLWPLTLGIGAVALVFNQRKRGLHDVVGGTVVVKTSDE